jgi:hypothetical protein
MSRFGARGETQGPIRFRVNIRDDELIRAIHDFQTEGQDDLRDIIREMMHLAREESQDLLLSQRLGSNKDGPAAGSVAGTTNDGSKNAYVEIAESLKITDDPLWVRLYSDPYPGGFTGSRGGKVAMYYAAGTSQFPYSKKTPLFVKSSIYWLLRTGRKKDATGYPGAPGNVNLRAWWAITKDKRGKNKHPVHFRKESWRNKEHPGFERIDFISAAQEYMEENFEARVAQYLRERQGGR